MPWWALATAVTRQFHAAYDALNCLPPTGEPRATGHIPEMVALIQRLIDGGHAYRRGRRRLLRRPLPPGVRRAVRPAPDAMQSDRGGRRRSASPLDFALWKGPSRASRPGTRRGVRAGRAGTSSARRWRRSTSARPSTSTAAGSTWSSRTTRTSSRSRGRRRRVRAVLAAPRAAQHRRHEDEQVARQLAVRR